MVLPPGEQHGIGRSLRALTAISSYFLIQEMLAQDFYTLQTPFP